MKYIYLSFVSMLGLSACATNYIEAPKDTSHAILNFVNEPRLSVVTTRFPRFEQKYLSVSNEKCDMPTQFAKFSKKDKDHKVIRIESDRKINVRAFNLYGGSSNITDVQPGRLSTDCNSIASFTPDRGGNYIVRLKETGSKTCEMFVIDYSTKVSPPDLKVKNNLKCG